MILSPDEIETLVGFVPKLIGFVATMRQAPEPESPIADFIAAHPVEIAIIERLSDFLLPGSGAFEKLLVFTLQHSHPMDAEEAAEWMRRQNTET